MIRESHIHRVYSDEKGRNTLYTKAVGRGAEEGETIREKDGIYRKFDPYHSKLAALILKGCRNVHLKQGDYVLYLGCSTGTTPTHVADIVGPSGLVFGIDIAPRVMRSFYLTSERYPNLVPILANAAQPQSYTDRICEVDYVYQDVAARRQVDIFIENSRLFLKEGGFGFLAVKARSVDVTKKPGIIYAQVKQKLTSHFIIIEERKLDPFSRDHMAFLVKRK